VTHYTVSLVKVTTCRYLSQLYL